MSPEFKTIALIGKYQSAEVTDVLSLLADFLSKAGASVWIEEETATATGKSFDRVASFDAIGKDANLAIVIGGDGTMLNAARRLSAHTVPLMGINLGRLGFLTDISRDDMLEMVAEVLNGKCQRERRVLLEAEVLRKGERVFATTALNDVVLSRGEIGRMIEYELHVDGEFVYSQRSDGMIVSTPTGSTAYALSANGPILHPRLAGLLLVPLCPHALTFRPIALSQESTVELVIRPSHDACIHFDGQTLFNAREGDRIRVRRSFQSVTLLHPAQYSYFAVLREKLHWSASPRLS